MRRDVEPHAVNVALPPPFMLDELAAIGRPDAVRIIVWEGSYHSNLVSRGTKTLCKSTNYCRVSSQVRMKVESKEEDIHTCGLGTEIVLSDFPAKTEAYGC